VSSIQAIAVLQRAVVRGKSVDERRIAAIDVMNEDQLPAHARTQCRGETVVFPSAMSPRSHPMLVRVAQ
jgi:hypothetical protein